MDELDQLAEKFESFFACFGECFARRDTRELDARPFVRSKAAKYIEGEVYRKEIHDMAHVSASSSRAFCG